MAEVFEAPNHIKRPSFENGFDEYEKEEVEFTSELTKYCKENSKCKHAGEILSFPVADGSADYMVFNYRKIIYLPLGDMRQIPAAHSRGLRKDDIIKIIDGRKALEALMASH